MIFPNELVDHILGSISHNRVLKNYISIEHRTLYHAEERKAKDALIDCSAVCRTWRQLALPHLFHTLAFDFDPPLEEDLSIGCAEPEKIGGHHRSHCDCKRLRSLKTFLTFIEMSPHIASRVKELRVFQAIVQDDPPQAQFDPMQILAILHRLPKLRVVWLQDVRIDSAAKYDLQEVEALGPPLTLDRFYYGTCRDVVPEWRAVPSLSRILPLFLALGDVQELDLDELIIWKFPEEHMFLPSHFRIGILKLKWLYGGFSKDNIQDCLSFFLDTAHDAIASLHTIRLGDVVVLDLPVVQKFIEAIGATIRNITLRLVGNWYGPTSSHPESLDLSPCTKLESLTFENADDGIWPITRLTPVFSGLCCHSSLHTITFQFMDEGRALGGLPGTSWGLDHALVQIPSLRRVVLSFDVRLGGTTGSVDIGRLLFPGCKAKGLLQYAIE